MASNITITKEPCTLVYTLINSSMLCYEDFYLLIRSLHSFMVESITSVPEANSVHVKLGYQASVSNAIKKLGGLRNFVSVNKLSSHVKQSELSRLEYLRQQYGLSMPADDRCSTFFPAIDPNAFKPKAKGRGGYGRGNVFRKPYTKRQRVANHVPKPVQPSCTATKPEIAEETAYSWEDAQPFTHDEQPAEEVELSSENNSGDEQ